MAVFQPSSHNSWHVQQSAIRLCVEIDAVPLDPQLSTIPAFPPSAARGYNRTEPHAMSVGTVVMSSPPIDVRSQDRTPGEPAWEIAQLFPPQGAWSEDRWIVDPRDETIRVLSLRTVGEPYVEAGCFHSGEQAASVLLAGFSVDVEAVFSVAQ